MSTLPVVVTVTNTSGLTTTRNAVINVNDVAPVSLFTTQAPTQPNFTDVPVADYELGTKFSSSVAGTITGIRYWRAASETGTHTGRIWSSTGTLLASVVFTGDTGSGWKTQTLATPLAITAGTTYTVSVNANTYYADTPGGHAAAINNGALTAPIGAGTYNNTPGAFPSAVYQNESYFRDIVFVPGAAPPLTVPVVNSGSFNVTVPASAGQVVGTMTATQSPTAWAITAGNTAGYFSISNAGVITTTAAVVAGSYSLTCRATNAAGNGTGAASITAAAPSAIDIPLSWNDPMFTGMTVGSGAQMTTGQTISRRSVTANDSGVFIFNQTGAASVSYCRVTSSVSNDCVVLAQVSDNTVNVDHCFIENNAPTNPTGTHADGIQLQWATWDPSKSNRGGGAAGGTVNISNSMVIIGGATSVTAGLFCADAWHGKINLTNVVFQVWAQHGLRVHSDSTGDVEIYANNVFFDVRGGTAGYLLNYGGKNVIIREWNNVRRCTVNNGVLTLGALIPQPTPTATF
jgi:hypothetical protein